jgi:hypothetical protein
LLAKCNPSRQKDTSNRTVDEELVPLLLRIRIEKRSEENRNACLSEVD